MPPPAQPVPQTTAPEETTTKPKSRSRSRSKSKSPRSSSSDSSSDSSRSRERYKRSQKSRSASLSPKPRKRSPSPKSSKVGVSKLTRNITKGHVTEIFANFGVIRAVDLPLDRLNYLSRGYAYVDYTTPEEAEKALQHMDGGWIDGQTVQVQMVLPIKPPAPRLRQRSPPPIRRRFRSPPPRRSPPLRYRRRSPPPRRRPECQGRTKTVTLGCRRSGKMSG